MTREIPALGDQQARQLDAGLARHDRVGEQQVDGLPIIVGELQRFFRRPGDQQPISVGAKRGRHQISNRRLILDDQHGSTVRGSRNGRWPPVDDFGWAVDGLSLQPERRAAADLAVGEDEAADLLERAVDHRQAEPGALARILRR